MKAERFVTPLLVLAWAMLLASIIVVLVRVQPASAAVTTQKFRRDNQNGTAAITGPLVGGKLDCALATTCTSGGGSLPCDPCAGPVAWTRITGAPLKYPKAIEADVANALAAHATVQHSQIVGWPVTTSTAPGAPVTTSTVPSGGGGTAGGWTEREGDVVTTKAVQINAGYGRTRERAVTLGGSGTYLARSGALVNHVQAYPHPRGTWVEVGERYNGGGYPFSNGFSWEVTKRGRTSDWYEAPPLARGIVRRPLWKFRAGQLVYAGNAATETPGAQWRALADCETGTKPLLQWCGTLGCIQTDGTCQFRRELQQPVAFTDGGAEFGSTWGADAYGGRASVRVGPDSPNTPAVEINGGDNISSKLVGPYPNTSGAPFYTSMADMGTGWHFNTTTGDPRRGAYENEINGLWNPRIWRLASGGSHSLNPPWLPPIVRTVPDARGTWPAGTNLIFSMEWEDETKQQSTAVSERATSITVPGPGHCVEIQVRGDDGHWPSIGGSREKVRALIFSGSKDYYCTYAGSIEKLVGGSGLGNDRLTFCTPDELYETQTCQQFSLNTKSVVLMGDPDMRAPTWRPGERVLVGRDIRLPTDMRDPFAWVPESANSSPDCATGLRAYTAACVTGATEPDWHGVGFNLAYDNGCCWRRLSMVGFALGVHGPEVKFTEDASTLPRIVSRTERDGTTTLYDTSKLQSYKFPLVTFGRGGLVFYGPDGVTPLRSYTATGVQ